MKQSPFTRSLPAPAAGSELSCPPTLPLRENKDLHSAQLLDHFSNPRHAGDLPDADWTLQVENPVCGDQLRLSVKAGERIEAIGFRARGCTASIACGSALTELLLGKTRAELQALGAADVEAAVGGLIPESKHAAALCADAVRRLEKEWK